MILRPGLHVAVRISTFKVQPSIIYARRKNMIMINYVIISHKVLRFKGEQKGRFVPSIVKEITTIEREIGRKIDLSKIGVLLKKTRALDFLG